VSSDGDDLTIILDIRAGRSAGRRRPVMDCCSVNGLNNIFNESKASKESKAYSRKGLDKRARKLID